MPEEILRRVERLLPRPAPGWDNFRLSGRVVMTLSEPPIYFDSRYTHSLATNRSLSSDVPAQDM
jgi:hypothetical protein